MQSFHRPTKALTFFRLARTPSTLRHASSSSSSTFTNPPSPPRLPKADQDLYERLQRSSTGAFSTPNPTAAINNQPSTSTSGSPARPQINQSPHSQRPSTESESASTSTSNSSPSTPSQETNTPPTARLEATGSGSELHPDVRRGATPEFDGDRNPQTGEVGGPKNEPLRWGGAVDWSYNGRVTDF
ncbi:MAG: hypothetical protein Q9216_004569 [Gyalolechia sp. 2 TL-2023]